MATSDAENQMNSSEPDDIVAEVRQYLADLPEQPGLAAARRASKEPRLLSRWDCRKPLSRQCTPTPCFATVLLMKNRYKTIH